MNIEDKSRKLIDHLQTVMEQAESLDKKNEKLSPQEIRVLRTIGREHCCVMSGIANAIRLSLSSVTGLIDRLVEKKLVKRDRSSEDRRQVQVELTEQGRELNEACCQDRVGLAKDMLRGLSAEEQDALLTLFGKISERIKSERKA